MTTDDKGIDDEPGPRPDAGIADPGGVQAPVETSPTLEPSHLIVGVGASAGGIDAFKTFFAAMPADSGMAFVLVQHLDPSHG